MLNSFKKNKLLSDFVNYFSGRLFSSGLAFLSIPIFTSLLIPEEYGIVSIFLSMLLILSVIMQLNISGSIRQYILLDDTDSKGYIYNITLLCVLLFSLFALPVLFAFKGKIIALLQINNTIYYFLIAGSFLNIIIQLYEFYLIGYNISKEYLKFTFFKTLVELVLSILLILSLKQNRELGRIGGIVLTYLIFSIFSLYKLIPFIRGNPTINLKHIKFALLFSIPLILHQLSHVFLAQIDRIIINKILDTSKAGLYSLAYNIGMIMQMVVIAFNTAWLPKFYEAMKNSNVELIKTNLFDTLKLLILLSVLASTSLSLLVPFLISSDYSDAFKIIHVIISSSILNFVYLIYANFSFYSNKTWYISIGSVLAAIINVVLNLIYIPIYGYKIAAYTTAISYLGLALFHYLISKYIIRSESLKLFKVLLLVLPYFIWVGFYSTLFYIEPWKRYIFEATSTIIAATLLFKSVMKKWKP